MYIFQSDLKSEKSVPLLMEDNAYGLTCIFK